MTFVITRGSLSAIEPRDRPANWYTVAPRGLALSPALSFTYGRIYEVQPAVRTVVDFLARNLAQIGIHTYRRRSDDGRDRLRGSQHPLALLLDERPNPTTTAYRLIYGMVADRAIYDVAFWLKVRDDDGNAVALRRISPRRMTPLDGDWLDVERYRIAGERGYRDVDRSDLVVFPGYSAEHESANGSSALESLRRILAEEYSAGQYREQLWRNGARSAGYIRRPTDAPEWSKGARDRFRAEWQAQYAGDGPNAGGTPMLEDGMEWVAAAVTPKDAQYIESRKLTREEVAAAYHIPQPMVGLLDRATFSNIKEQHTQLYVDTLGPWAVSSEQEIMLQLTPEFPGSRNVYVEFDFAAKLRGDFAEQADGLQAAVGRPYMTPNEGRARLNLPAIEGGDELLVPLNMGNEGGDPDGEQDEQQPADDPAEPDVAGDDPAPQPAKAKHRHAGVKQLAGEQHLRAHETMLAVTFERQQRSVAARAGAKGRKLDGVTAADLFDRARWDRELQADLAALAPAAVAEVANAVLDTAGAGEFDPAYVVNFLAAQTTRVAEQVNAVTEQQIEAAVEAADDGAALQLAIGALFAAALTKRVFDIARSQITGLSGFGTIAAAQQVARAEPDREITKRWITGQNPRPTHAAMDGQTVPYDAPFSNGALWPADAVHLDVDDVAGCNCDLEIIFGE